MLTLEDTRKFMYIESAQIPLKEVKYADLKQTIIDPTTGKPYKGIILEGCFVDLSNIDPNNNKRFYDIPTYLELLQILKKQIFSPKGVYGEYEHPKGYAVDGKYISHKILDVWYVEEEKKVYGRVLLLNSGNGLLAQEVIRTGGQLGISARAAGEEIKRPDGFFDCKVKLLTTFDLVYHPGFSAAVLGFKELNESEKMMQNISESKKGFSGILYDEDIRNINTKFMQYINLNENRQFCFYEWYLNDLSEAKKTPEQKQQQNKMEQNTPSNKNEIENELKKQTDIQLKQQQKIDYFKQVKKAQNKLGASYYQGSAGFINSNQITI